MYNLKQYHQQQNYYKNVEKCIKYIKHFKHKNNNIKSIFTFILDNNKPLNLSKKILGKEIYKYKYI
jgi:hypothetical protein